jgi:hypothetical protein
MPNFVPWLESQRTNVALVARDDADVVELERALTTNGVALSDTETPTGASVVLAAIAVADWHEKSEIAAALKPLLLKLGARYIYHEKKRSKALCQVANFHIRNGAIFERINWLGDPSPKVGSVSAWIKAILHVLTQEFSMVSARRASVRAPG